MTLLIKIKVTKAQRHRVEEDNKKCQAIKLRSENIAWNWGFGHADLALAPSALCLCASVPAIAGKDSYETSC